MIEILPKLLGAAGLILITTGVVTKNAYMRNWLFAVGGVGLLLYSIYLKDPVFIPLQIIFTSASAYEIYTLKKKK